MTITAGSINHHISLTDVFLPHPTWWYMWWLMQHIYNYIHHAQISSTWLPLLRVLNIALYNKGISRYLCVCKVSRFVWCSQGLGFSVALVKERGRSSRCCGEREGTAEGEGWEVTTAAMTSTWPLSNFHCHRYKPSVAVVTSSALWQSVRMTSVTRSKG